MHSNLILKYKKSNDEKYFNEIKKEYGNIIFSFAKKVYRKAKYFNEDLDDCNQLCWMWFIKIIENYDEEKNQNFNGFLFVCLNNYINNHIRDLRRHKELFMNVSIDSLVLKDEDLTYNDIFPSDTFSPSYQYELNEALEIFNSKDKLKDIEKTIFMMYLNGFTYKELSKTFQMNEKQIDNVVRKVKERIKRF